jgi:hypothetical protein
MKLLSLALLTTVAIMGEASAEASAAAGQARRNLRQRQTAAAAAAASSAPGERALAHDDAPADDLAALRRTRHGRRHRRGQAAKVELHNDQEFGSRVLISDDVPPVYGPGEHRGLAQDEAPLPSPDEARALVSDDAPPIYGPGERRGLAHDDAPLPSPDEARALAHDDAPDTTTTEEDRYLAHDDAPSDDHVTRTLSNCDDFEGPSGSCN